MVIDTDKYGLFSLTLLILLTVLFITSFIIHMPTSIQKNIFGKIMVRNPIYSDFSSIYQSLFMNKHVCRQALSGKYSGGQWFNIDKLKCFCHDSRIYPVPYMDYYIDLPPLTGFLWLIETYFVSLYAPLNSVSAYTMMYILNSTALYVSMIIAYVFLARLLQSSFPKMLLFITSSLVVYGVYNWELFALLFLALYLYLYYSRGYSLSTLLFLGLFASTYYLGLILILYHIYRFFVNTKGYTGRSFIGMGLGLIPYLILLIIAPQSLFTWYNNLLNIIGCNNCIYVFFKGYISTQFMRALALGITGILLIIYFSILSIGEEPLFETTSILLASVLFNIEFLPQTLILIQPLIVLLIMHGKDIVLHYTTDILNSSIILLWFKDLELRKSLEFLGIPVKYDPLSIDSPIQWIAQTRNMLLVIFLIVLTARYINKHREKLKKYMGAGVA